METVVGGKGKVKEGKRKRRKQIREIGNRSSVRTPTNLDHRYPASSQRTVECLRPTATLPEPPGSSRSSSSSSSTTASFSSLRLAWLTMLATLTPERLRRRLARLRLGPRSTVTPMMDEASEAAAAAACHTPLPTEPAVDRRLGEGETDRGGNRET
jgi:hypothetical protein